MLWSVLFFGAASTKGRISVGVPVQHKRTMKATFKNSKKKLFQSRKCYKSEFICEIHVLSYLKFSVFCV